MQIKARDLYDYIQSPFTLWCKYHAPQEEKDKETEFQKMLMKAGQEHETNIITTNYPTAQKIEFTSLEEGIQLTKSLLTEGNTILAGIPIGSDNMVGIIDLAEKQKGKSNLGDYYYKIKEIKLAKNIKKEHLIQANFYNYIIGQVQGYTPDRFTMINKEGIETDYEYDEEWLLEILNKVKKIINGERPNPTYGKGECPFSKYTDKIAEQENSLTLIGGIGETARVKLNEAGYLTVKDIAEADIDKLILIERVGNKTAEKWILSAKAILSKSAQKIQDYTLPEADIEIFLDLEGAMEMPGYEGLVDIDYMIGNWVRSESKEEFVPFIAQKLDGEKEMFIEFWNWLKSLDKEFIIYHWHHYENTHLRSMCLQYKTEEDWKWLSIKMIDLYKIATQNWIFPTYGNSLKKIAPFMGFKWRHDSDDVNAMESMAFYYEWVKNPKENKDKLQKIIDYNEDDVIATKVIKDWLVQHN